MCLDNYGKEQKAIFICNVTLIQEESLSVPEFRKNHYMKKSPKSYHTKANYVVFEDPCLGHRVPCLGSVREEPGCPLR